MSNKLNNLITEFAADKNLDDNQVVDYISNINDTVNSLINNGQTWGRLSGLPAEWFGIIFEVFNIQSPVTFYRPVISVVKNDKSSIGSLLDSVIQVTQFYKTSNFEGKQQGKKYLNELYCELSNVLYHKYKERK